jgi:hypothetical protein
MTEAEQKNRYEGLKGYELAKELEDEEREWRLAHRIAHGGFAAEMLELKRREEARHDAVVGSFELQRQQSERLERESAECQQYRTDILTEQRRNNDALERIATALEVFSRRAP